MVRDCASARRDSPLTPVAMPLWLILSSSVIDYRANCMLLSVKPLRQHRLAFATARTVAARAPTSHAAASVWAAASSVTGWYSPPMEPPPNTGGSGPRSRSTSSDPAAAPGGARRVGVLRQRLRQYLGGRPRPPRRAVAAARHGGGPREARVPVAVP